MYLYYSLIFGCVLASGSAWLPPERCAQGRAKRSIVETTAPVVSNIDAIAAAQLANLQKTYQAYSFNGIPLRPHCDAEPDHCGDLSRYFEKMTMLKAYNCSFYTYPPRPFPAVTCGSNNCKLIHTVSTVDTYTASEGYNWGVKIASKLSLFEKVFEIGGEVSTGGTYTCTYSKGRTTTDTVECTHGGELGKLQLYSVRTDMKCDFGTVTMEQTNTVNMSNIFTLHEMEEINDSASPVFCCRGIGVMVDTSKISDRLLKKLVDEAGGFDPYTDIIQLFADAGTVLVRKYKEVSVELLNTKIVPFTNEHGDSVYEYSCQFTRSQ